MSTHTPGPWKATGDRDRPITGMNGVPVVGLDDDGACGDPECCGSPQFWVQISKTDARLIAAAPELLEALEELVKRCPFRPTATGLDASISFEQIKQARAAIAKARGES